MRGDIHASTGSPSPLGLSFQGDTVNFSVSAAHASAVFLLIFEPGISSPIKEIPLQKSDDCWHIKLTNLPDSFDYSYRADGPRDEASGLLYKSTEYLADPYARIVPTSTVWADQKNRTLHKRSRCKRKEEPFDWQGVSPPCIPMKDLVIYEMHVRGFTRHPSSSTPFPGTYLGLIDKIPYLKKLGINAVEFLPIFEFDETHIKNRNPKTGESLPNYWGYNPLHFFAPMNRYAHSDSLLEFKTLVRELHRNGIEVLLDVVYNHTGEEEDIQYYVNLRGLDNKVYYITDSHGRYIDYSGCGNAVNSNQPIVQRLILDSLRYWVEEMHVDGFRFDLASILTRDSHGNILKHPPVLTAIANEAVLKETKLIAEAWDAWGLYQVGSFYRLGPWSEWNGKYRDIVRRFIKGTHGQAGGFADVFSGSERLYGKAGPDRSINFIAAHDGFSLRDLVTYQQKHNYENGEMNQDGSSENDNWNSGVEGPTTDPQINALRERQLRNFLLALFLSKGVPMLHMGDEYGHTRYGNNNPYVMDNEINWFLWDKKNEEMIQFVSALIALRREHPLITENRFYTQSDVDWHGMVPFKPDWSDNSQFVALTLKSSPLLYIAFNAKNEEAHIFLPSGNWRQLLYTVDEWSFQSKDLPKEITLAPYSAIVAIA